MSVGRPQFNSISLSSALIQSMTCKLTSRSYISKLLLFKVFLIARNTPRDIMIFTSNSYALNVFSSIYSLITIKRDRALFIAKTDKATFSITWVSIELQLLILVTLRKTFLPILKKIKSIPIEKMLTRSLLRGNLKDVAF